MKSFTDMLGKPVQENDTVKIPVYGKIGHKLATVVNIGKHRSKVRPKERILHVFLSPKTTVENIDIIRWEPEDRI